LDIFSQRPSFSQELGASPCCQQCLLVVLVVTVGGCPLILGEATGESWDFTSKHGSLIDWLQILT
jgi:hypothetical protein